MSRGIRWVPAKSSRLGQVITASSAVAAPNGMPQDTVPKNEIIEKVMIGGLVLAGATLLWTWAFGGRS